VLVRRLTLALLTPLLLGAAAPSAIVVADTSLAVPPPVGTAVPGAAVPPVEGSVLKPFDPPATPFGPGHRGVDLAARPGEPVRAALAGEVRFAGQVAGHGWITVDHGGGLDTTYGWIDPRVVGAGDRVDAGDVLGSLAADASHLDWGARLGGDYIDPLSLLGAWRAHLVPVDSAR
jgi:murein DD-endopeptidase MepM/ murein hydrolase activator NlpD